MADEKFNISFQGEVLDGSDVATVKVNIGKLFKLPAEKLEKLFTGKKVIIKAGADKETAMKYRALMRKSGAICYMEPVGGEGAGQAQRKGPPRRGPIQSRPIQSKPIQTKPLENKPVPDKSSPPAADAAAPKPAAALVTKKVAASAPATSSAEPFDTSNLDSLVMPKGSDIGDTFPEEYVELPNIDHIDMAEVGADVLMEEYKPPSPPPAAGVLEADIAEAGSDMGQIKDDLPMPDVDISHLSMGEVGEDVLEEKTEFVEADVDISGLSMAEVGADVYEVAPEKPKPVNPDTSGLSLED